ncbi:MAG: hypothetical protein NT061_02480, partial [Spirochaetes bacterium]|nr:hypothetical protein [Spirochaetota bacterium]
MRKYRQLILLFFALICVFFSSCRPAPAAMKPSLSLDQGFEALFPTLSTELSRAFGKNRKPNPTDSTEAAVIVASPYSAEKISGVGIPGENAPPTETKPRFLVVPFAGPQLTALPAIRAIGYDYNDAYARMGAEAARTLGRNQDGKKARPNCAIVFQSNFMRGNAALEAFSASFAAQAGEGRLFVKNLPSDPDAVDAAGAAAAAIREASGEDIGLVVLAVDSRAQAEAAAGMAAAGASTGVTVTSDRLRTYFADMSSWDTKEVKKNLFAYRIEGNEAALARAAIRLAQTLAEGRPAASQ